jgi:hypothetical protein
MMPIDNLQFVEFAALFELLKEESFKNYKYLIYWTGHYGP